MTTTRSVAVPAATGGRMIQLDVLRGIAILLVLCRHKLLPWVDSGVLQPVMHRLYNLGWTGVDLFFVLSGFLIGGLLVNEIKRTDTLNVKRFLIRRGFKIWPAYLVFIGFVFVLLVHQHSFAEALRLIWPNLLHLQNYFGTPRGLTWSLAVEEHFYLVLPVFLLLAIRHRKPGAAIPAIPITAIALILICTTLRIVLNPHEPLDWWRTIAPTHLRIDGLFFGVLLAYLYHLHPQKLARIGRHRALLIVLGLTLISPMAAIEQWDSPFVWTVGLTMLYLGYGSILVAFIHITPGDRGLLEKAMASRLAAVVAWIGVFSYSIYLWHWDLGHHVIERWLMPRLPQHPLSLYWLESTTAYMILAILVGVIMAKLVEMPFLALRERLVPRQTVAVREPAISEMTETHASALLAHQRSPATSLA